jgi:hypothetical protein
MLFHMLYFLIYVFCNSQVQEAVANCLPPLVPAIKSDAPDLVRQLLALLLDSDNYGERRGAAYGLAGLVKGLGILSLKQLDIMPTLTDAIQDKKNPRHREGYFYPKLPTFFRLIDKYCFFEYQFPTPQLERLQFSV